MSTSRLASVALLASCALAQSAAAEEKRHWQVIWMLTSGSNYCNQADAGWIREDNGSFAFHDVHNKREIWKTPMQPDGSVTNGEVVSVYSRRRYRVNVPPGTGPRTFDLVDLSYVCRMKMVPK